MKRRGWGDQLTGGTGDICPQCFRGRIAQTSGDVLTEADFTLPIPRLPTSRRVTIIEVLKIRAQYCSESVNPFVAATAGQLIKLNFTTRSMGTAAGQYIDEPTNIGAVGMHCEVAPSQYPMFWEQDLTDSGGHGVLVGTDKIWVQLESHLTSRTQVWAFNILYRFKTVDVTEYVGIVQSQT